MSIQNEYVVYIWVAPLAQSRGIGCLGDWTHVDEVVGAWRVMVDSDSPSHTVVGEGRVYVGVVWIWEGGAAVRGGGAAVQEGGVHTRRDSGHALLRSRGRGKEK